MLADAERDHLIQRLKRAYDDAIKGIEGVDPDQVIYADSGWRAKDLIAHITAWEREMLRSLQAYAEDGEYRVPGYTTDDAYNAGAYLQHRDETWAEVRSNWDDVRRGMMAALRDLPAEKVHGEMLFPWGERGLMPKLIGSAVGHANEHIAHIQAVHHGDSDERARWVQRLDAAYRDDLDVLSDLDPELVVYPSTGWRVKDVVAHLAFWEGEAFESLERFHQGTEYRLPDFDNFDAYNARLYEARRDVPFDQSLQAWVRVQRRLKGLIRALTDAQLDGEMRYASGAWGTVRHLLKRRIEHPQEHIDDALIAAGKARGDERAEIIDEMERTWRDSLDYLKTADPETVVHLDSGWRVKDLVAHMLAWDEDTQKAFDAYRRGGARSIPGYVDVETYNQAQYRARRDEPWDDIYDDWEGVGKAIMAQVARMTSDQIHGTMTYPSGKTGLVSQLLFEVTDHQREHMDEIRERIR